MREVSRRRVVVRIRLGRRTRNHLGSMYFGALATGADAAIGYLAMLHIRAQPRPIALLFRRIEGDFVRRAVGHVDFVCEDGEAIADLVARAASSNERCDLRCAAFAEVAGPDGQREEVARFALTLSLRAA